MNITVLTQSIEEPILSEKEILRYAAADRHDSETLKLMRECLDEAREILVYKICYCRLPLKIENGICYFGKMRISSHDLSMNLNGCTQAVVFAATVGFGIDRLISKYSRLSPSKALMFQAIGAERIESLCNAFEEHLHDKGLKLKPRFSSGYGDLPLDTQKNIFSLLDCTKRIGVSLNQSMLMSPSKSVTAFLGVIDSEKSRFT